MKTKKSSIRQEIDSQFGIPQHQEDIDDFENPIADAVKNLISDDIQTLNSEDISDRFSSLRTRTFNDDSGAKGKSTSRNKLFKDYHYSLDTSSKKDEIDDSISEGDNDDENENEDQVSGNDESEGSIEPESEIEEEDDDDENNFSIFGSEDDGVETLDDSEDEKEADDTLDNSDDEGADQDFLYSKQSKTSEIEKGKAVQQQIALWDAFLECRIRLQKGIVAFNKFPSQEVMEKFNLVNELEKEISEAQESVSKLMEILISLHKKLCNQYEGVKSESKKRKSTTSDEGGVKRRKLKDYDSVLNQMKDNFICYQNEAIQKWNDKTKVASGKTGHSNFSAFDQSVLSQIEHILKDKARLVRRTQQRKSKYTRVGELGLDFNKQDNEEALIKEEYDVETFDDDDFYHKILRDYIEKKTVDINDPQKLGKQWMELQKLRSKMKRKVDVKCTKGRKLRYGVHEKLVNFMAPVLSHQWNLDSETELFKSLFGKKK